MGISLLLFWLIAPGPVECVLAFCAEGYIEKETGLFSNDGCPIYNCAPPPSRPTGTPCPEPSCPAGFILELQTEDYDLQQLGQSHQDYDHLSQNGQQHMDYDQLSQQSNADHLGQLSQSTDDQQSQNQQVNIENKFVVNEYLLELLRIAETELPTVQMRTWAYKISPCTCDASTLYREGWPLLHDWQDVQNLWRNRILLRYLSPRIDAWHGQWSVVRLE